MVNFNVEIKDKAINPVPSSFQNDGRSVLKIASIINKNKIYLFFTVESV